MTDLSKLNHINVGPGGTFKPSGIAAYDTTPQDVDAIFADLATRGQNHILLYFHGGLVDEQNGMDTAGVVTPLLQSAGVHPVSFIWETGFLETIGQNLSSIRETDFFKKVLEKVIKVAGSKLSIGLPSVAGARAGEAGLSYNDIRLELQREVPFQQYIVQAGTRSAGIAGGNDNMLSDEIEVSIEQELLSDPFFQASPFEHLDEKSLALIKKDHLINIPEPGSRGVLSIAGLIKAAVTVVFKVIKRFAARRDHGFYPTVIEEILREIYVADFGTWLWSDMKSKAEAMWETDTNIADPLAQHAGGYFLKQLKLFADTQHGEVTIDLIGHSAGAIVICHFVEAFNLVGIRAKIRNTIFMAPACRSDLFYDKIIKSGADIGRFRMFTMTDHYECLDYCVKYVYTHSLLYLISGILEANEYDAYILGMQRYLTGTAPYDQDRQLSAIREYMSSGDNRSVLAVTAGDAAMGLQCIAQHHGGFADPAVLTIGSIAYLLKN